MQLFTSKKQKIKELEKKQQLEKIKYMEINAQK